MASKPSQTLKLIGIPFSTFTRTIALGLLYKEIEFEYIEAPPHTTVATQHHPLGYIPSLSIEEGDGKVTSLCESQAIARYIDRVAPIPSLGLPGSAKESGVLDEKVWESVSLISSFGFPTLEGGVIKPYVKALDEGNASSFGHDGEAIDQAKSFLTMLEARLMVPDARFAFGEHPTWADFFLYPQLADLRAIPAWESVVQSKRFLSWITSMDELEVVKKTTHGTLAVGGRPDCN